MTVVIDGRPVEASVPAVLSRGRVVAPLDPYFRWIATRIAVDGERGALTFERDGKSVTVNVPLLRDDSARIPLAATVRALGGTARYESRTKTLEITLPVAPLATMTPFRSWSPPPGPLPTFTPTPVPTPRPTVTGIPQPRRTPILIQ